MAAIVYVVQLIHYLRSTSARSWLGLVLAVAIGAGVGTAAGVILRRSTGPVALAPLPQPSIPASDFDRTDAAGHLDQPATAVTVSPAPTRRVPPTSVPSPAGTSPGTPAAGAAGRPGGTVRIAAAGDIACPASSPDYVDGRGTGTTCRQQATSDLLVGRGLDAVLALGDLQYENGSADSFGQVYDPTWGRVRPITRPAIGNHEYNSGGGGYFDYFGAAAGPRDQGWYSFDQGAWHLVALNSNCDRVGCGPGSAQQQWLAADLAAHPNRCTLAFWHHPRWSGGEHGDNPAVGPLVKTLYAAGADLVLAGHDHDYERFAPLDPSGAADLGRGLRQFVVGSGGKSHYRVTPTRHTEAFTDDTFGVLELTLRPTGYDWSFRPEAGRTFTDHGSTPCH